MITISGYNIIEEISKTSVFQWIRAEDINGNKVILQIPNPAASWNTEQIQVLKDYFLTLQDIAGIDHIFPNQVLSDPDCKLIIQFPDKPYETLNAALARTPENAERLWRRICDSLYRLHIKKMEHGNISLNSFVVLRDRIYLTMFGYAPLLKMGHAGALTDVRSGLAPEVSSSRHELTNVSDIYALAKAVAAWKPDFENTDIYKQATKENPQERLWLNNVSNKNEPIDDHDIQSELISYLRPRMFTVSVTIQPSVAGTVVGGGEYKAGTEIQVIAKPKDGWRFSHWTADLNGNENPVKVKVDRDKKIFAEFVPLPVKLSVEIKPRKAGIAYVDGSSLDPGNQEIELDKGQTVKIEVKPNKKWKFSGWQGDISGSNSSVDIIMNINKSVVANFEKISDPPHPPVPPVPIYELEAKVEPHGAGSVSGTGRYQDGTDGKHSKAIIEAKPKKGYKFNYWDGDIPSDAQHKNPLTLTMDDNKTICAHFTKVIDSVVNIKADVEPPRAGRVVGVGRYSKGTAVTLEAYPASTSIRFGKWMGDVRGRENPVRIRATRDMYIKACFIDYDKETSVKNKVRLMILASPITICPFLVFITTLMALWALGISITSGIIPFLCINGLIGDFGIFLTRFILSSERLNKIALKEYEEEHPT